MQTTILKTSDYKLLDNETLLQWYANASATCSCGGHYKGNMNDSFRLNYALELRERGIFVPKNLHEQYNEATKQYEMPSIVPEGIFNGDGSF